jgi:hypothetical protein
MSWVQKEFGIQMTDENQNQKIKNNFFKKLNLNLKKKKQQHMVQMV